MIITDPDYARIYTKTRLLSWSYGYSCVAQGTGTRDLDLLIVPWTVEAKPEALDRVIKMIAAAEGLKIQGEPSIRPHGRLTWTLLFPGFDDPRFVDISGFRAIAAEPTK